MTSPPYKPQCNGAAENAVKLFKNGIKKAVDDASNTGIPLLTLISRYLFYYRSSIHCSTNETPFKLMFSREMRTHFNKLQPNFVKNVNKEIDNKIVRINNRRKSRTFKEGDRVFIRNYSKNGKPWVPAEVQHRRGANVYICKTKLNQIWKRHSDQIRALVYDINQNISNEDMALEDIN